MNIGHIIKAAWVIIALACVSYVGFGFGAARNAEAADVVSLPLPTTTLADITEIVKLFPNARFIVRDTRTIIVWTATSNTIAKCFIGRATRTLSQLGQTKIGFKFEQWTLIEWKTEITQEQCYAVTFAPGV
jgi:hypothetical protein